MNNVVNELIERMIVTDLARQASTMISPTDLAGVLHAIVLTQAIPGDIIEMGCFQGTTSRCIAALLQFLVSRKQFHVCDSFTGLPKPTDADKENCGSPGDMSANLAEFTAAFTTSKLPLPIIHKGWFSEIVDYPKQLSMAFCDGDLYQSILDSLQIVYPRLAPGGMVLIHDMTNQNYPGVRQAVDAYFTDKPERCCIFSDLGIVVKS